MACREHVCRAQTSVQGQNTAGCASFQDVSTCGYVHHMNGAIQGDPLWDIHTQDILRCGAVHERKRAPPCAGLPPLRSDKGSSA